MGEIYYKGKNYNSGIKIEANENQIIVGDTNNNIKASPNSYIFDNAIFVMDKEADNVTYTVGDIVYTWNEEQGSWGLSGGNKGPQLMIKNLGSIVADMGGALKVTGTSETTLESGHLKLGGANSDQYKKSDGSKGKSDSFVPEVFFESGKVNFGNNNLETKRVAPEFHFNNGFFAMQNNYTRDGSSNGDPVFIMNGASSFIMNSSKYTDFSKENLKPDDGQLDPFLCLDPYSFMFVGQTSKGAMAAEDDVEASRHITPYDTSFPYFEPHISTSIPAEQEKAEKLNAMRCPRIKVGNNTLVIIDSIGARIPEQTDGRTVLLMNSQPNSEVYFQATNNCYFEINDNAVFQMAKNQPTTDYTSSREGKDDSPTFKMYGNAVFQMAENQPTTTDDTSEREEKNNSPIFKMYGKSSLQVNQNGNVSIGENCQLSLSQNGKISIGQNCQLLLSNAFYCSLSQGSFVINQGGLTMTNGSISCNNGGSISCNNGGQISCDHGSQISFDESGSISCNKGSLISCTNTSSISFDHGSINLTSSEISINGESGLSIAITYKDSQDTSQTDSVTFSGEELKALKALVSNS